MAISNQRTALPAEEQERRRQTMCDALVQVRLEGLEPDPVFFDYAERYSKGEITLAEALADFTHRITGFQRLNRQAMSEGGGVSIAMNRSRHLSPRIRTRQRVMRRHLY
ncbi:MAG: antitoxin VbhA family protein [Ktedonobacterales bacterium]